MQLRTVRLALITLVAVSLTACDNNRGGGGGGGQATTTQQAKSHMAPQVSLRGEGRDLTDAYARVPWIHANLLAADWDQALGDVKEVDKRLEAIRADRNVNTELKAKILALKPQVAVLSTQIQKHDKAAVRSAVALLNGFTRVMNDPQMVGLIHTQGGGAGR